MADHQNHIALPATAEIPTHQLINIMIDAQTAISDRFWRPGRIRNMFAP